VTKDRGEQRTHEGASSHTKERRNVGVFFGFGVFFWGGGSSASEESKKVAQAQRARDQRIFVNHMGE